MSITPSASIKSALAVVFIVNKLVNRTMRLRPLIVTDSPLDLLRGLRPRAAKPGETYTKARSGDNRVNPAPTPCDEPPQRRNILH
jgi:hypothetical protein